MLKKCFLLTNIIKIGLIVLFNVGATTRNKKEQTSFAAPFYLPKPNYLLNFQNTNSYSLIFTAFTSFSCLTFCIFFRKSCYSHTDLYNLLKSVFFLHDVIAKPICITC